MTSQASLAVSGFLLITLGVAYAKWQPDMLPPYIQAAVLGAVTALSIVDVLGLLLPA